MKQVWKYTLKPGDFSHEVPKGGIVRHVDEQFGEICIWIEVDPTAKKEDRRFDVFGTGHSISEGVGISREYLGTVKLEGGALVFHVYEYTGI